MIYFRLEKYFSNKNGSSGEGSQLVDSFISEENDTIAQLRSNKQNSLNTSKGTEANDIYLSNNKGKQNIQHFIINVRL